MTYGELIEKLMPYKDRELFFDGYDERTYTKIIFYVGDEEVLVLSRKWGKDDIEISENI